MPTAEAAGKRSISPGQSLRLTRITCVISPLRLRVINLICRTLSSIQLRMDGQPFYLVDCCEIAVFVDRAHGHRRLGDAQEEVVRTPA